MDLTPTIQRHLFVCLLAWTHEVQARAPVTQNHSRELRDYAQVARAEHETLRQRSDVADLDEPGLSADDREKLAAIQAELDREAGAILGPDGAGTKHARGGAHHWPTPAAVGGVAVLMLFGMVVWNAARGPLLDARDALRSRLVDAPASSGRSRAALQMETARTADRAAIPDQTRGDATSAPRSAAVETNASRADTFHPTTSMTTPPGTAADTPTSTTPDTVAPRTSRRGTPLRNTAPHALALSQGANRRQARSASMLDAVKTRVHRDWDSVRAKARKVIAAVEGEGSGASKPDKGSAVAMLPNQSTARTSRQQSQSP